MKAALARYGRPGVATAGALGLTVLLPMVELGRIATFEPSRKVWVAAVATAVYLPLHVRHVRYALGRRSVPAGQWTLLTMGAVMLAASLMIGTAWGFMLASLAVSVMLVLPPPWSIATVVSIIVAAFVLGSFDHPAGVTLGGNPSYLAISVAFRTMTLLVVIWLVAAVDELRAARAALAAQAVRAQRSRAQAELGRTLTVALDDLATQARATQRLAASGDPTTRSAVVSLIDASRRRLDETRRIVASYQGPKDRAQLAAAADILRAGDGGAASHPRRSPAREDVAPADADVVLGEEAMATVRRSRLQLFALHVPIILFVLLISTTRLTTDSTTEPLLAPVVLLLGALQLRLSFATARGTRPKFAIASLGLTVLLTAIGFLAIGNEFSTAMWFVAASVAMTFRGRLAAISFAVVVVFGAIVPNIVEFSRAGLGAGSMAWYVLYIGVLGPLGGGSLYAAARLVRTASRLATTRAALAEQAAEGERRRFSRDLHDRLGQSLSAISLKGDLALALLERDPTAAGAEIGGITDVAERLAADARAVTFDSLPVSFVVEAAGAVELLRAAGVNADVDVELGRLSPEANVLFGWAIREGATNVLRHSTAKNCVITAVRDDGRFGLELVNDGALHGIDGTGNGLVGLADRAQLLRGVVSTDLTGGRFRLRVLLPEDAG